MRLIPSLLVVASLAACSDDPFKPTMENVPGNYVATTLRVTDAGGTTDYLAAGSSIDIWLLPNGTVTGRLFIKGGDENGGDLDADMAGTWQLTGNIMTFDQAADTFVRDWPFTVTHGRLAVDQPAGGVTVRVVLSRLSIG